jgi:hypothetical protein
VAAALGLALGPLPSLVLTVVGVAALGGVPAALGRGRTILAQDGSCAEEEQRRQAGQ